MKPVPIFLIVLAFSMQLPAVTHARPHSYRAHQHHPHSRFPPPTTTRSISRIPWQTVLAGGTAVSGIVFAYKVADGIQTGTVEAARSSPETFLKNGKDVIGTLKIVTILAMISFTSFLGWRLARHRRTSG